jgi:hypothetical protein
MLINDSFDECDGVQFKMEAEELLMETVVPETSSRFLMLVALRPKIRGH